MIEYQYKVVMIPQRRNQQYHVMFEGTKKECKNYLERFETSERMKYFIGQYYENSLNKVFYCNTDFPVDLVNSLEIGDTVKVTVKDESNKIPIQPIENVKNVSKQSLDILKEKYK